LKSSTLPGEPSGETNRHISNGGFSVHEPQLPTLSRGGKLKADDYSYPHVARYDYQTITVQRLKFTPSSVHCFELRLLLIAGAA
jgi:hypothetical protein